MPNKKINQLVSKTSILSTDLFPIGDATSGQLYKKTVAELQAAIGGAVISVNGLVGTVVLDTDDIQELGTPTNKYFTDARARGAVSATSPLVFNSSTGVFSMPAATTSANGYLTSTDWNTFNGKENVLTFSSPLVRTSNTISIPVATTSANGYLSSTDWTTFNNKQGALTLTVTGSSGASTLVGTTLNIPTYTLAGLGGIGASFLSGGTGITYNSGTGVIATTITQYTDALARASLSFTAGSGAYNSTTGVITIPTNTSQLTNGASFITLGSLSGGTGISYNSTTGAISYSGTVYTDTSIRGLISLTTTGSSGASTYNSTTGVLNIPNYGSSISGTTNYISKFTSSSGIGNSLIYDDGSNILIGSTTNTQGAKLKIAGGYIYINETSGADVYLRSAYDGNKAAIQVASTNDLAFVTNNITRMILNSSGNLCIGQTLSNWNSGVRMLEFLGGAIGTNNTPSQMYLLGNAYLDSVGWKYTASNYATKHELVNGQFTWATAPSSTINSAITWTQQMTLTNGGNLLVGTSTDSGYKLDVNGTGRFSSDLILSSTGNSFIVLNNTTGTTGKQWRTSSASNGNFYITQVGVLDVLTLAPTTGAATFSSSVTAQQFSASDGYGFNVGGFQVGGITGNRFYIYNGTLGIDNVTINPSTGITTFARAISGTSSTFSSSVTAGANIIASGTGNITVQAVSSNNFPIFQLVDNRVGGSTWNIEGGRTSNCLSIRDGSAGLERMIINSSGSVGIGTSSPGYLLHIKGADASATVSSSDGTSEMRINAQSGLAILETISNTDLRIRTNSTERGRITAGGNWLLGTSTDNGERLYVSGAIRATGTITANSDIRLKKNLERIENALEKVGQISGYTYNTIYDDKRHGGIIAQEVDEVFPEIVNKGNDGLLGVEYGNISALLIEALKEATTKIKALESKVEALQNL